MSIGDYLDGGLYCPGWSSFCDRHSGAEPGTFMGLDWATNIKVEIEIDTREFDQRLQKALGSLSNEDKERLVQEASAISKSWQGVLLAN